MNMDTVNQYLDAYGYGVIFIFYFLASSGSGTGRITTRPDWYLKWSERRTFDLFDLDGIRRNVRRHVDGIWRGALLWTDRLTIRSVHRIDEGALGAGVKRLHGTHQSDDHRGSLYSWRAANQSVFCGMKQIPFSRYFWVSALGSALWVVPFVLLGHFAGKTFHIKPEVVPYFGLALLVLFLLGVLVKWLKRKRLEKRVVSGKNQAGKED